MRHKLLGGLLLSAWIGVWPMAAHADYMSDAQAALKKGDLRAAQIDLRNAVRADPQNAGAHFWLGRVSMELGDAVAAEREAEEARRRGFNPQLVVPLLARALLQQNRFAALLDKLQPGGNNADLNATILVFRGYAQLGLQLPEDAQKSFEEAAKQAPNSVEPLLAEARLAQARGQIDAAQHSIDRALQVQPKSADALLAKAQLQRAKGDPKGALATLNGLLAEQPTLPQAHLDRASLEILLHDVAAAKKDVDQVLKDMPGNVAAIYLRAVMKAAGNDFAGANADLERISPFIDRIPRGYFLLAIVKEQLGQLPLAIDAAERYLSRTPNDLAAYQLVARLQFQMRHPDRTIKTLSKVVDSGKADAATYDLLGRAYAATNQGEEAIKSFQKAESLAPNDVGVQTRLARVRMGMGQPDAAMGDLEHTLQIAPKLPAVGEALFFAALATGDMDKAKAALEKVQAAQGDTVVVENLRGLFKLATLDLSGAHDIFAKLMEKDPNFLPAKINLARVVALQGQTEEAVKILSQILDAHPAAEPALTMLASNYVQTGQVKKAIALVERAHAAEPDNLRLVASLGDLYVRDGSPQKALDLADSIKGVTSNNIAVQSMRAAALLAIGQRDKAISVDTGILNSDPDQLAVRTQLVNLLMQQGNYEQARTVVKAGIAAMPRSYKLFQEYALIDLKASGLKTALATADQLMSQNPGFPMIQALKGDLYLAANRPEEAVDAYQRAQQAAPATFLVTRLAQAQARAGHNDQAIETLVAWTKQQPKDLESLELLSEFRINAGKLDAAEGDLQELLKHKPHDAVALNNLAWIYQQQKNPQAKDLARQAYILSPSAQTADTLGWILTTGGDAVTGVALLRQASSEAADPRIHYHYAVALKDTGQKAAAIKVLTGVVAAKGDFTEKAQAQQLLTDLTKGS